MYTATTATYRIAELRKRIRAVCGGTSAGKTIGILQILAHLQQTDASPKITSVVSESLPHLKLGAMRDYLQLLKEHHYYKESNWNRTNFIYTDHHTGSTMEFFGADSPAKAHGPRRHRLFGNELNNIPRETFDQLEVRTSDIIFADWNPTNEFYFYTDLLPTRGEDIDFITLTYKDNEALSPSIVKSIESRQGNKNWWKVYGLGQLGNAEGIIYRDWKVIPEIPFEAKLLRYGLDFGYTNDPTAIVAIYRYDGGYLVDEICFQKGLSNRQIADLLQNEESALVMADSAEPKSIDEIASYGVLIRPCTKGRDSIVQGIQFVQDQRISVTSRSLNVLKERRNYMWETDRDGKILNVPIGIYNHAMDAIRYGLEGTGIPILQSLSEVGETMGLGGVMIPDYDL